MRVACLPAQGHMMNKKIIVKLSMYFLITVVFFVSEQSFSKEVVLAFDATLSKSTSLDGMARSKMIIKNLARVDVFQSMFLVRTSEVTPKTIERLIFYDESGQLIVNKGNRYSIYNRQSYYAYPVDIMKADAELQSYIHYVHHVYYPYLYEGGNVDILSRLRNFLAEHNYLSTYITDAPHDEYLDNLYQQRIATNHTVDIQRVCDVYVNLIIPDIIQYDAKAQLMLGFSPRQVLLLHENDVAAYCIVELVDALNAKGFNIVSPEKVFTDPVVNPFFSSGYSAVSYMPYLTGLPEPLRDDRHVISVQEQEKIHNLLRERALDSLLAP